ncbi:MAG: zinc ribbon domain-containing protein [Firmicutes bacterium]|nr:zinc ribbon domain-containing protein [Bacillota bacterium]
MPLYDFRCEKCQHAFEANVSLKDKEAGVKPSCPNCESKEVSQIFRPLGFIRRQSSGGGGCSSGFG